MARRQLKPSPSAAIFRVRWSDIDGHEAELLARRSRHGLWRATRAPAARPPSIAVLPFDNMSGDPAQDYFADGMSEDLITALSRIRWLFVIAATRPLSTRTAAVDVRQVARELGVRYVLEGSARRAGNQLRVSAQLIDAGDGGHHWAEQYDRKLGDIFAVQDEITRSVVAAIEPRLLAAEGVRAFSRSFRRSRSLGAGGAGSNADLAPDARRL